MDSVAKKPREVRLNYHSIMRWLAGWLGTIFASINNVGQFRVQDARPPGGPGFAVSQPSDAVGLRATGGMGAPGGFNPADFEQFASPPSDMVRLSNGSADAVDRAYARGLRDGAAQGWNF
eukprot:Selendium_serpulae@DN878_c0_g1_i1.p1